MELQVLYLVYFLLVADATTGLGSWHLRQIMRRKEARIRSRLVDVCRDTRSRKCCE